MTREDIDTLWQQALQESVKAGEQFTRYHFAALVADAEAKRIHDEGMVTVGYRHEQIASEKKRADALAATIAALRDIVTNDAESKTDFIARVREVVGACPDQRVLHAVTAEREACAVKAGEFARKWWSLHCDSNKHMETTRKAHDDFCALQAAIRARGRQ